MNLSRRAFLSTVGITALSGCSQLSNSESDPLALPTGPNAWPTRYGRPGHTRSAEAPLGQNQPPSREVIDSITKSSVRVIDETLYGLQTRPDSKSFAFSLSDQEFIWETPATANEQIVTDQYVITTNPEITALDRETGKKQWKIGQSGLPLSGRGKVTFSGGSIVMTGKNGTVVTTRDGSLRWRKTVPVTPEYLSESGSRTVLSTSDCIIRVRRCYTETERESLSTEVPRAYVDGLSATGNRVFNHEFSGVPSAAIATKSTLYVAIVENRVETTDGVKTYHHNALVLYAIDLTDGEIVGRQRFGKDGYLTGVNRFATIEDDLVVLAGGYVYRLATNSFHRQWTSAALPENLNQIEIATGKGSVFVAVSGENIQSELRCLDAETGKTNWTLPFDADRVLQLIVTTTGILINSAQPDQIIQVQIER